jgi:purine-nucleoside phosphorylase
MSDLWFRLEATKEFLRKWCGDVPSWGLVLGSGFSVVADEIRKEKEISFREIPYFKTPSVSGHSGQLVMGTLGNTRVLCLKGRLHYYEGHSMDDVTYAVRALAHAGVGRFVLTNASGSLRPEWAVPSLVLITDHLNLLGTNPLLGPNEDRLGPRFPDLGGVYTPELADAFRAAAGRTGVDLKEGVYAAITGPCYETAAEVKMYRTLGADLIGMSTIPEAIALKHMGRQMVGLSCVTNTAGGAGEPVLHTDVLESVRRATPWLKRLLEAGLA